jgi:hypothetical protein
MHDCRDHIHHHFNIDGLNKELMNSKLEDITKFKGFDDFMYFSYKYWPLIKDNTEASNKAKELFLNAAKKFNKFKTLSEAKLAEKAEKYLEHLNETTRLIFEKGDVHNATVLIGDFAQAFTIQDKFVRNFNKKIDSAEI